MKPANYCVNELLKYSENNESIWVLDGDLGDSYGLDKFFEERPEKTIMAGIAEQNMVTMAAGMAACSARPWVFSFAAFLCYRAYDQIRVGIAQTGLPVTLVGSHSGGCIDHSGKTHQALNDIAVMASLANIEIWSPCCEEDTQFAVSNILNNNNPAYIRYPRESLNFNSFSTPIAKCRWLTEKCSMTFISHGYGTQLALETSAILESYGIHIGVIHVLNLKPFPLEEFKECFETVEKFWVIEDHVQFGGLNSILQELGFFSEKNYGWSTEWAGGHGSAKYLLETNELSPSYISNQIKKFLVQS
ncbi:transketolase family protein [Acinetobacter calcoaceticus]|uniref:transketolase family protein n=1 Tax=Acinetobacter calcoaceticus TaxID=471 RepID=UPI00192CB852|nr:transketolase C-terminal domain-containing protein [Acinetobacter calcoaceticus]